MTMKIDDFKTTLAGCSSELLDAYIDACQEELAIRKLKETLKHLDKAQLRILLPAFRQSLLKMIRLPE
ncbi:MAG: hypothetical protein LM523_07760 [Candidatus Contendobacter sp.]|nr:hypothetical protein [Candidatus Contendobacter sp.]